MLTSFKNPFTINDTGLPVSTTHKLTFSQLTAPVCRSPTPTAEPTMPRGVSQPANIGQQNAKKTEQNVTKTEQNGKKTRQSWKKTEPVQKFSKIFQKFPKFPESKRLAKSPHCCEKLPYRRTDSLCGYRADLANSSVGFLTSAFSRPSKTGRGRV